MRVTKTNLFLSAVATVLILGNVGCDKSHSTESSATKSSSLVGAGGFKTGKNHMAHVEGSTYVWPTEAKVSLARRVEVGDHPNIVLEEFEIGNRAQKVRYFMADDNDTKDLIHDSAEDRLFLEDEEIAKIENQKWSIFGFIIQAPSLLEMKKFSASSMYNGLAVTPQVILCATKALETIKAAGDRQARVFQNWQIDKVNIFVKPVQHSSDAESRLAIDPKINSLNVQISLWTRSGDCFSPDVDELTEALSIADQRIED